MLEKLRLTNFRCFKNYEVEFGPFNVLVGKNDKGKSTVVDALKLLSNVLRYAKYRSDYLEDRDIPFPQINLRYNYTEKDSIVYARFSDNTDVQVVFPFGNRPYAEFARIRNSLGVIPPVGTFEEFEKFGSSKYLQTILVSHLTSRHFRNIWYQFSDGFEKFQKIIEETWPGYIIEPPEFDKAQNKVTMFFKENGMTREIFWGGHGFQVWLQLMTFLVKLGHKDTLILDEPDIYLHSDMQKKLVNMCKERSNQVVIATHAVDIIEEVEPSDVVLIDKDSKNSKRLSNIDEVQTCITQLGSYQNLKLAHLARGKICLFVEGSDFRYLKAFARRLNEQSLVKEQDFSVVPLGGRSNWDSLLHIDWLFSNAFGEKIKCYVVLDRDYYTDLEVKQIVTDLEQKGVKAHIWERKEIENYAIDFKALYRILLEKYCERYNCTTMPLSMDQFEQKALEIFEDCKREVLSQIIAHEIRSKADNSIDHSTIIAEVIARFNDLWRDIELRKKIVPGKVFFAKLNEWLTVEYHIEISVARIINSLHVDEIPREVKDMISEFSRLLKSH